MILIFFGVICFTNSLQTIFETFMCKSSNFIGLDYKNTPRGWGCSPGAGCQPGTCELLGSIPSTTSMVGRHFKWNKRRLLLLWGLLFIYKSAFLEEILKHIKTTSNLAWW